MEGEMGTFSLDIHLKYLNNKGLTFKKGEKIRSIEREWKRRSALPNDWWILRNFPLPRFSRDRWKELDRFYQRGSITDNINERKKEGPAKNLIWTRDLFPKYSFRKICNSHTFKWDLLKTFESFCFPLFSRMIVQLWFVWNSGQTTRIAGDTVVEMLAN